MEDHLDPLIFAVGVDLSPHVVAVVDGVGQILIPSDLNLSGIDVSLHGHGGIGDGISGLLEGQTPRSGADTGEESPLGGVAVLG